MPLRAVKRGHIRRGKRRCTRVHRDTLLFVLETMLPSSGDEGDSGAVDGDLSGTSRASSRASSSLQAEPFRTHSAPPEGSSAPPEGSSATPRGSSRSLRSLSEPRTEATESSAVKRELSEDRADPSANRFGRGGSPSEMSGVSDFVGASDYLPSAGDSGDDSDGESDAPAAKAARLEAARARRCRWKPAPRRRRKTVAPDVVRADDVRTRLCVAAQHAAGTGRRAELLDAFSAVSSACPRLARLSWELALTVALLDGGGALPDVTRHYLRHCGLDRPASVLAASAALLAAGRRQEALRMAATTVPQHGAVKWRPVGRRAATASLQDTLRTLALCAQTGEAEPRALLLQALRGRLEALLQQEEVHRPPLARLLESVQAELD